MTDASRKEGAMRWRNECASVSVWEKWTKKLVEAWLKIARIACTRGTPLLELRNTQNKSVSRKDMVVHSTRVCNGDAVSSKEVNPKSLESVGNSHPTTSICAPSVHTILPLVPAPVTRASYKSYRACRSADLALK